jgi:osmotically-inducible protein OsmY
MRKTNSDLHKDVLEELTFDPSIDERNIGLAVADGAVTLTGTVPSYMQKLAAERAVKRVGGVHGIVEELKVDLPTLHHRGDADIVATAMDALKWNLSIPKDAVIVKVESGWITLTGIVDWQFQREAARMAVASLAGIRGVSNEIALQQRVTTVDVKAQIRESFRRNADIDASHIAVESSDGTVTLRGPVHTWNEHDYAAIAAYSIPGVIHVKNLVTVS